MVHSTWYMVLTYDTDKMGSIGVGGGIFHYRLFCHRRISFCVDYVGTEGGVWEEVSIGCHGRRLHSSYLEKKEEGGRMKEGRGRNTLEERNEFK